MLRAMLVPLLFALQVVLASPIPAAVPEAAVVFSALQLNAPTTLSQCTPATFSWTATQGPYYLSTTSAALSDTIVVPAKAEATWIVDVPAGTTVVVTVTDAAGAVASSETYTVAEGSAACMLERR